MNASIPQEKAQAARVIPIKIGDHVRYSKFKCLHLEFPGMEQLKKDLARYRQTQVLIQLFDNACGG